MQHDWIKMRTDLYRDPRVCRMAEIMMCNGDVTGDVTRNVMRCATVGALVSVWGVTRHRGKRVGDNLVVSDCDEFIVDDIAELQGFGSAMVQVGWASKSGKDLVFPDFFKDHNNDPREKANERQRRYRERKREKSDVTGDVTVDVTSDDRERVRERVREENTKDLPNGKSMSSSSKRTATTDINEVVSHFKKLHPRSQPGDKERKAIADRLKDGYSVKDLKDAIDGMHASPHNQGRNDNGRKYLTLELCMRNSSKVTQYLDAKTTAEHGDEIPF